MFSETTVRALLRDKRLKPPVASLYLNTDRGTTEGEKYLASFRHLIHTADQTLARQTDPVSPLARERLSDALPELLAFLDEHVARQQAVRGIALFVSLADAPVTDVRAPALTAFTLPRPVRNHVVVDRRPAVRPLLFLLDQYERTGVIVADRTHARIFTLYLGELEEIIRRTADTPQRHARGGWKQMLFQRDIAGHLKAHIRATVREAAWLFRKRPLKRLVLGGTDETLTLLKSELHPPLRSLLAGTFVAEAHASDATLVSRALDLAREAESASEAQRVQELLDALATEPGPAWQASRQRAVHGVAAVLRALTEKRAQRLLLRRGFRLPGAVCDNCGTLTAQTSGPCPSCHTPLRPVADILEYAVEQAEAEGAEVEFVAESATLESLGGVGALLRF